MAGSGVFGYKLHDLREAMKRNAIISEMIEINEENEKGSGPIWTAKSIVATEINMENNGNDTTDNITADDISFELKHTNSNGEHNKLHLENIDGIEFFTNELVEGTGSGYRDYVVTVCYLKDGKVVVEQMAMLPNGNYANVYGNGVEVNKSNYHPNTTNSLGPAITAAIEDEQGNEFLTRIKGGRKFKRELQKYFEEVPTEYLEIIAESIREKGVIDPSLYGMIDPSLYLNGDAEFSEKDVADSTNIDAWKAGLRVVKTGPISINESGKEENGNEDREN